MGKISVSRSSTIYLKLLLGFCWVKEADGAGPELGGDPEGIAFWDEISEKIGEILEKLDIALKK